MCVLCGIRTDILVVRLDVVDVHALRHRAHLQLPRTRLDALAAQQQLIAFVNASVVVASPVQRDGQVERIHGRDVCGVVAVRPPRISATEWGDVVWHIRLVRGSVSMPTKDDTGVGLCLHYSV